MKRLGTLVLIACVAITGCMDLGMKMEIGSDGSGTATLRLEMLDQMYQLLQMQAQQSGTDTSFFEEDALRALIEKDGGEVRKYVNEVSNGIRTMNVEIWFANAQTMVEQSGQGQITLTREKDLWVLKFMDNDMASAMADLDQETLAQQMQMLLPSMAGLKWNIEFVVPELVETNLTKLNGTTSHFELDYEKDFAGKSEQEAIAAFKRLLAPKWVKFRGVK